MGQVIARLVPDFIDEKDYILPIEDTKFSTQARDVERSASGEHAASARGRREGIAGNRG